MRGYVGAEVNFTSAMLAATLHEARYGVEASGLQWNVILALVWTRERVLEDNSFVKLAFQWRFHEHPHPFNFFNGVMSGENSPGLFRLARRRDWSE